MKRQRNILRIASYIFLIITSFIMIYPVLFMALGTFTTTNRFLDSVILPIPNTLNQEYFISYFRAGFLDSYVFTLERAIFYIITTLFAGLIGGYILSKMIFPGRNRVFLLMLASMVMPGILMLVPSYLMMAKWPLMGGNNIFGQGGHGFVGQWPVLFVGGWVPIFAIFLLKQSFDMLPSEYEDAAKMDGAGMFTIIFQVYAPLLLPPIVALVILTFLGMWNDYLWPALTISGNVKYYPVALAFQYLNINEFSPLGVYNFPLIMVKAFLATWPPAVVYFLLQRYFVQGMVASGLKG
jgi:multiple sugar transport system permease protein